VDRGQSIEERTIKVFQGDTQGSLGRTKTRRNRTITKLPQVQEDLDAWYEQTPGWTLVFEENAKPWTANKYAQWRKRVYNPMVEEVLGERIPPYDLCRHAYVSLLLAAGRPLHEIAAEAGPTVAVLSSHYALIIPEFQGKPPVKPEVAIAKARAMTDKALARELAAWRKRRGTLPHDAGAKEPPK